MEIVLMAFLGMMQLLIVVCGAGFFITGNEDWFTVLGGCSFFFYVFILAWWYSSTPYSK